MSSIQIKNYEISNLLHSGLPRHVMQDPSLRLIYYFFETICGSYPTESKENQNIILTVKNSFISAKIESNETCHIYFKNLDQPQWILEYAKLSLEDLLIVFRKEQSFNLICLHIDRLDDLDMLATIIPKEFRIQDFKQNSIALNLQKNR